MTTFALVGHCGADTFLLKRTVLRAVPGASLVSANDANALEQSVMAGHVLLVNRSLDGLFEQDGVAMIESLIRRQNSPVMMVISNFEDAQRAAEAAGALPGFGKAALEEPQTVERLQTAARMAERAVSE